MGGDDSAQGIFQNSRMMDEGGGHPPESGHLVGAFSTLALGVVAVCISLSVDASREWKLIILLAGLAGAGCVGWLLTRSIARRRMRRRTEFEEDFRAEQEREHQRKLAEAKAKGDIK